MFPKESQRNENPLKTDKNNEKVGEDVSICDNLHQSKDPRKPHQSRELDTRHNVLFLALSCDTFKCPGSGFLTLVKAHGDEYEEKNVG